MKKLITKDFRNSIQVNHSSIDSAIEEVVYYTDLDYYTVLKEAYKLYTDYQSSWDYISSQEIALYRIFRLQLFHRIIHSASYFL